MRQSKNYGRLHETITILNQLKRHAIAKEDAVLFQEALREAFDISYNRPRKDYSLRELGQKLLTFYDRADKQVWVEVLKAYISNVNQNFNSQDCVEAEEICKRIQILVVMS